MRILFNVVLATAGAAGRRKPRRWSRMQVGGTAWTGVFPRVLAGRPQQVCGLFLLAARGRQPGVGGTRHKEPAL